MFYDTGEIHIDLTTNQCPIGLLNLSQSIFIHVPVDLTLHLTLKDYNAVNWILVLLLWSPSSDTPPIINNQKVYTYLVWIERVCVDYQGTP